MNMDKVDTIFVVLVIFVSLCIAFAIIGTAIDTIGKVELEDKVIECVVIHKDIDNNMPLIAIFEADSNFSETIKVSYTEYAQYEIGGTCTVLQKGYHYPISGNLYSYEIIN